MEDSSQKYDVTVLMGGPGRERDVSLMSGEAIAAGLEAGGHKVTRADISPEDTTALDREGIDVVFIALHGEFGESGEVQELCQQRALPYTGSGPLASRLGMDKAASKQILKRAGLHTPDWMIIENFHDHDDISRWLGEFPPPVVVKPVDGGSSVDIYICPDENTRKVALEQVLDVYSRAMIERFMPGREFTVSVLGDKTLPVLEIVLADPFYNYHAKYDDDARTQYVFDHNLDTEIVARMEKDALLAHRRLGCRDISRSDFILDENGKPQFIELNTIPGFTSHSLLPKAAAQAGIDFSELVDRILKMAVSRKKCLCTQE